MQQFWRACPLCAANANCWLSACRKVTELQILYGFFFRKLLAVSIFVFKFVGIFLGICRYFALVFCYCIAFFFC